MAAELPQGEVTAALSRLRPGDSQSWSQVIRLVYKELRSVAARCLRAERPHHTLQPTALVHETYLRLFRQNRQRWHNRTNFLAVAAHLMRLILVDYARNRNRAKRQGDTAAVQTGSLQGGQKPIDLEMLHEALGRLAERDSRQSRIVELRYFGGLTVEETAAALGISAKTVKRDWAVARAWLHFELKKGAR